MIDGLQNDANRPILFTDRLIVNLHALQYVVKLELLGKLIKKDDSPFGLVFPNGALYGGFNELQHYRKDLLIVFDLVQLKDDHTLIFQRIGLIFIHLKQVAV